MTKSETDFFRVLKRVLGENYYIFPQIHLGVLISPRVRWTKGWWLWRKAFFYSDRYSVDYVICDTGTVEPKLVIELDDASHHREKRRRRDRIVNAMLNGAGITIIHISSDETRDVQAVVAKVSAHLQT
jgi:hypothetical protein